MSIHYTILDANDRPVGSVFADRVVLSDSDTHYHFFRGRDFIASAWYGYKNCETGQIVRLSDLMEAKVD